MCKIQYIYQLHDKCICTRFRKEKKLYSTEWLNEQQVFLNGYNTSLDNILAQFICSALSLLYTILLVLLLGWSDYITRTMNNFKANFICMSSIILKRSHKKWISFHMKWIFSTATVFYQFYILFSLLHDLFRLNSPMFKCTFLHKKI